MFKERLKEPIQGLNLIAVVALKQEAPLKALNDLPEVLHLQQGHLDRLEAIK